MGAAGPCGLGVIRSLSRAGIPLILADPNPAEFAMHTRFARKHVISALSGRSLIEDLHALSATIEGPSVLFLTNDEAVMAVSEFRGELKGHYRFRLPDHDALISLMHKRSFQRLAEQHGFSLPRSSFIGSPTDFNGLSDLRYPCIIKPAVKTSDYYQLQFARAYKVNTRDEAEELCLRILPVVPDLVVQEWIEGEDDNIYFCMQYGTADGRAICSFTGRKLSIWPPDVGVTASCTAAREAHAIVAPLTEAFFRKVGFSGMGAIEYKRDVRTGEFLMIEPTVGRVDRQEEVATLHGVNIPLMAYCHEIDIAAPSVNANSKPGVWRDHSYLRAWRTSVARNSKPRLRVYDAYWRANDPMPGLSKACATFNGLLATSIRSTMRRIW